MTEIARAGYHHLWWENRIRLVMGSLFVFVASNQVTSLEITLPPMFSTDQDQPDKPQLITNSQLGSVPLYGMDDHLVASEASMDSLHITSEYLRMLFIVALLLKVVYVQPLTLGAVSEQVTGC